MEIKVSPLLRLSVTVSWGMFQNIIRPTQIDET